MVVGYTAVYSDLHGMNLERLELAIAKLVDPGDRGKAEVNDEIQHVVAVDLDTISVMLFEGGQQHL